MKKAEISLLNAFADIPAQAWDAMACPEAASGRPMDPFTTHRFLLALDQSGSTGAKTGWQTHPLILRDQGRAVAAMPLYVKGHSQGEYIFDHGWADAFQRAGGNYYPKLQAAVPFTPATGRRFLGPVDHRMALLDAAIDLTVGNGLSSLHVTFCSAEEAAALQGHPAISLGKSGLRQL
jgi:predicted N-acyltransferase